MKILVVDPIVRSESTKGFDKIYSTLKVEGVSLNFESLKQGPLFIETEENEVAPVLAFPPFLQVSNDH